MKSFLRLAGVLPLVLIVSGCFQIEQTLEIRKDLSGKAGFNLGVDFEPMIMIMAAMQRSMSGKEGPPTKEELAAAKKDFLEKSKKESSGEAPTAEERAKINSELPAGVTLDDISVEQKEMRIKTSMLFGFDKLSKLADISLPKKEGGGPEQQNVIEKPFESLQVVEDAKSITITSRPSDPTAKVSEETKQGPDAKADPEMEKMMREAFSSLKVSYRITAPFEVIETNATRQEGNTQVWEWDLASMEKLEKSGKADLAIRVKYRK